MQEIRDTGLLSESEMYRRISGSPYTGMHNLLDAQYKAMLDTAKLVGMGVQHREHLIDALSHADSAVRYWSAVGLAAMGDEAEPGKKALRKALTDSSPSVRIAAAEALCNIDLADEALPLLAKELKTGNDATVIEAATTLFAVGPKAKPVLEEIQAAKKRKLRYSGSALDHVLDNLK